MLPFPPMTAAGPVARPEPNWRWMTYALLRTDLFGVPVGPLHRVDTGAERLGPNYAVAWDGEGFGVLYYVYRSGLRLRRFVPAP